MTGTPTRPRHEDPALPRAERVAAVGFDYASQPKHSVEACDLCGAAQWTVVTHSDRYGYPATAQACSRCGLTVLSPRMTAEAYADFYAGVYRPLVSAYHGRRIDAVSIQTEQAEYAQDVARLLEPFLAGRAGARLLDVGGSTGVVAGHLADAFGLSATVIDPAPDEAAQAAGRGIETITGFVEDWDPAGRQFEAACMFQTIDHLLDAPATLAKLRDLVTEDGILVCDIVDFRAAYLRGWSVEGAVKVDHPYYLTEQTAEAMFARAGFDVARKSYAADHLHVAYVCRPGAPQPDRLPPEHETAAFFHELRYVHNARRPGLTK